jgi:hypothetical protein
MLYAILGLAAVASNPSNPISRLSDEFVDASTLIDWSRIHAVEGWNADQMQVLDIDTTQTGRMVMVPHTSTWYQDYRGELTFKTVPGDFAMTTEVTISGDDGVSLPQSAFSLAGIMFRTPREITDPATQWFPGGENYVFLSLGYGLNNGPCLPGPGVHFESKSTINSDSSLCLSPTTMMTATIQIARVGDAIICLARPQGGEWEIVNRFTREDFPDTLQAGLVTYTDYDKVATYSPFYHNGHVLQPGIRRDPSTNPRLPFAPDLIAGFEYARYVPIVVPNDLIGVDLVNEASLKLLLIFLGDAANLVEIPATAGDLDDDGDIDGADLGILLALWGTAGPQGDFNADGSVDGADLGQLLGQWTG